MVLKSRATRLALEVLWGEDPGATDDPFVSNTLRELLGAQLIRGSAGALAKARKTLNLKGAVDLIDNQPLTATDVILGAEQVISELVDSQENNWEPDRIAVASVILVDADGTPSITGIVASAADQALKLMVNVGSAGLDLPHESASSSLNARFRNIGDATTVINPGGAAWILRDEIFNRWLTCIVGIGSFTLTHLGQPLFHEAVTLTHTP